MDQPRLFSRYFLKEFQKLLCEADFFLFPFEKQTFQVVWNRFLSILVWETNLRFFLAPDYKVMMSAVMNSFFMMVDQRQCDIRIGQEPAFNVYVDYVYILTMLNEDLR